MRKLMIVLARGLLVSCAAKVEGPAKLTAEELRLIMDSDSVMRVLVVDSPEDSLVLRQECTDFSDEDLRSDAYMTLAEKMVATVTDPSQDGVGIAGPQVGLNRRIIAVQRFDKEDAPFEVYANIQIDSLVGETVQSSEGCLSIPGYRGYVPRSASAVVTYKDPYSLMPVTEYVDGYTAIIFQHEVDHLSGILYTDKADSVFVISK